MNATADHSTEPAKAIPQGLEQALEALKSYDLGSNRGSLIPIDDAVVAALKNESLRSRLELRLITALAAGGSMAAKEYICSKLRLIGSKSSVAALATSLGDGEVGTAARSALETLPCREAGRALRASLGQLKGPPLVGAITSLGFRREPENLRALTALLRMPDPIVVGAALAAIGATGTPRAARVLLSFKPKASEALRPDFSDAALVCAGYLLAADRARDAAALYRVLLESGQPSHVQAAAQRGLKLAAA